MHHFQRLAKVAGAVMVRAKVLVGMVAGGSAHHEPCQGGKSLMQSRQSEQLIRWHLA